LEKYISVLSFFEKLINKLLVKKNLISLSEIDVITNETIGNIPKEDGDRIIKYAKKIGINIPKYMDNDQLKRYIEEQEMKRRNRQMSYSDKLIIEEKDV
jgi:hypothetical protein